MLCIGYIAFACYPPISDTSQDRGLIDMFEYESYVNSSQYWCIVMLNLLLILVLGDQGVALKET
jgi:hypothetical protein